MMQTVVILTALLLVGGVAAEQPQEVSNVQPVPVQVNNQPSHVVGHTSAVESGPQPGAAGHQHFTSGQVVGFEPQSMPPQAPHYYSPSGMIQVVSSQGVSGEQQQQQQPAVGAVSNKPGAVQTVRHYAAGPAEQYGQPESASIPPNYKPFGSWGLYIGGNPADGYYSNYYKALSSSVADKQQAAAGGESAKPAGSQAFVSQASGFGASSAPFMMKQGPMYPQAVSYQDQGYYPYGEYYTPAELNSGSRVTVQNQMVPSVYSSGFSNEYQPQQSATNGPTAAAMYYGVETYAAKKGAPSAQAFGQKDAQTLMSPAAKGYQQRMSYAYASQGAYQAPSSYQSPAAYQTQGTYQAQGAYQAPTAAGQASYQHAQPQVVAYPVPVGSQMLGSQPGAEGAFQPYGVHGFTRYAVKPTVVSNEQTYYHTGVHSAPASQFPVYKQQFVGYQQPMSFYGYPLSQLHYSTGAVSPAFGPQSSPAISQGQPGSASLQGSFSTGVQHPGAPQGASVVVEHSPAGPAPSHGPVMPVEAASSEKSETSSQIDNKQVNNKQQQAQQQQKRA